MNEQEIYNQNDVRIAISKSPNYIKIHINKVVHYFTPEDGDYDGYSIQTAPIMEVVK